jgi:hypothetical protein
MDSTIGRALGTDYFLIGDQLSPEELDYLAARPWLRRQRRAASDQRVLGAPSSPGH